MPLVNPEDERNVLLGNHSLLGTFGAFSASSVIAKVLNVIYPDDNFARTTKKAIKFWLPRIIRKLEQRYEIAFRCLKIACQQISVFFSIFQLIRIIFQQGAILLLTRKQQNALGVQGVGGG